MIKNLKLIKVLYIWAFAFHGLLWVHMFQHGEKKDLAIVTMALGLLLIWGVALACIQIKISINIKPIKQSSIRYFLSIIGMMIFLALLAEVISSLMTQTAHLWQLSPNVAYITATPNYIELVTKHSVIVFIPQFIAIAYIHYKVKFSANQWFYIYGLIGYLNEWIAFGSAASWVSIPYWIIIYGWIVYLPTYLFHPKVERKTPRVYHFVLACMIPLALSIPWALLIIKWFH